MGKEETSRWEVMQLPCGKGESFLVETGKGGSCPEGREQARLPGGKG